MHFLVDANLPRSALTLLDSLNHDVKHVRDLGMGAAPDEEIAQYVRRNQTVLLTRDMDFSDIRRYPPADYFGIVVLRVPEDLVAKDIVGVIKRFLGNTKVVANLSGRLAIVEQDRFRIRPTLD